MDWFALESTLTAHVSERMLDLAHVRPGIRLLDLACGRGEPALRAAQRVGDEGRVVACDLWRAALDDAQAKAEAQALTNIKFTERDASEADALCAPVDVVTMRWGLMYAAEPLRVLQAAHRALKPDGLLVIATWAEPERVPWWSLPREAQRAFVTVPEIDFHVPSPFRYASREVIQRDLRAAQFELLHHEEMHADVVEASSGEGIATWIREVLTRMCPQDHIATWEQYVRNASEAHRHGDGMIRLGGITHVALARKTRMNTTPTNS